MRLDGSTWRHVRNVRLERCADCGRCDEGYTGHDTHDCSMASSWFAGERTVCTACFAHRIRVELRTLDVDLSGIPDRAALGDAQAIDHVRRLVDDPE